MPEMSNIRHFVGAIQGCEACSECETAVRCAEHAGKGELTYVHCKAGRGRSTTLVICYLIREMRMDPDQAYSFVRTKRPQVCLAEGQWNAVKEVRSRLFYLLPVPLLSFYPKQDPANLSSYRMPSYQR